MLDALYYPYADVQRSDRLLLASLYFDNIYVLEPNFFGTHQDATEAVPTDDAMRPLVRAGIVKPVGPALLGLNTNFFSEARAVLDASSAEVVRQSIAMDVRNPELQAIAQSSGMVAWQIPTGQQLFWNGLGILLELSNDDAEIPVEIYTERPQYYADLLAREQYANVVVSPRVTSRLRGRHHEVEVRVPFLVAESLMTTIALLACTELGLVPLTDDRLHHAFMSAKVRAGPIAGALREASDQLDLAVAESALAMRSVEIQLPRLEALTAERVVAIRSRCGKSLQRFRASMRKLRHAIEASAWSTGLEAAIEKIMDTEISPAVATLRTDLLSQRGALGVKVLEDVTKIAPLPLFANVITGCPVEFVLAASAGAVVLKDALSYRLRREQLKKNGLYFLIDFAG